MAVFKSSSQELFYETLGSGALLYIWTHGWGQSGACFRNFAETLKTQGTHYLVDFPGFGSSPIPTKDWTTGDYAELMAEFIRSLEGKTIIWIGHSFGCRVGIKLASLYPNLVSKMILIAAPGLPRKRKVLEALKFQTKIKTFKFAKKFIKSEETLDKLRAVFGSPDYKSAGPLRNTFMNVVREHLDQDANKISTPTILIYGAEDEDTQPNMGERYFKLIPNSTLHVLPGFDHYSILTRGTHQVCSLIKRFVEKD